MDWVMDDYDEFIEDIENRTDLIMDVISVEELVGTVDALVRDLRLANGRSELSKYRLDFHLNKIEENLKRLERYCDFLDLSFYYEMVKLAKGIDGEWNQ